MTLKLGMQHRVLKYYQIPSKDNPGLTLTYFTTRSNLVPYAFVWGKGKTMDFSETTVVYDLKLATDDQSDKKFLLTSKLCPLGAICPLPRGYIHVLNHEKNVYNQNSRRFLWNLQQMGKVIRPFCWQQNFVSWGLSAPAPGLYTWIKSWKKLYKIRLQRHVFLNSQQMNEVTRHFSWHQNFVPWGMSVPALGLYTCIKSWKKLYKIRLRRDVFKTCNKWPKWQDVPVDIKISSPRGCQPLPRGYMYKIM